MATRTPLRLVALLGTLLSGACASESEDEDAAKVASELAHAEMQVLQFNLTHNDVAWNDALSEIQNWGGPVIATLQEVCFDSQWKPLADQKSGSWVMAFHHQKGRLAPAQQEQDQANKACPKDAEMTGGKAAYGNAVVFNQLGNDAEGVKVWEHSFDANAPMNWGVACARLPFLGIKVTACSTHLVVGDPPRRKAQTKAIDDLLRAEANAGSYPVIGGDFNTTPSKDEMDFMYAHNGQGIFCEAAGQCDSRDGDVTAQSNRKIDYIFFGKARFVSSKVNIVDASSDHKKLKAKAAIDVPKKGKGKKK